MTRVWLEPPAPIHPAVQSAIAKFDAVVIGPGSFFTSLMPTLLVDGVAEVIASVKGPVIVVSNLLTEGQGMRGFTAADEVAWVSKTIGRKVDVVIANQGQPSQEAIERYAAEHKHPLPLGNLDRRHRSGGRRLLAIRNRAPRSPAPVVCGLVGAVAAAAGLIATATVP